MSKCMYQKCNCEATIIIPCTVGLNNVKEDIYVCEFHFNELIKPEPFVSVSIRGERK